MPHPNQFTPGKETRYPLYKRLGGPQDRSRYVRQNSPPPGFNLRTVQPVTCRYTYYAFPARYPDMTVGYLGDTVMRNLCQTLCLCAPPFP